MTNGSGYIRAQTKRETISRGETPKSHKCIKPAKEAHLRRNHKYIKMQSWRGEERKQAECPRGKPKQKNSAGASGVRTRRRRAPGREAARQRSARGAPGTFAKAMLAASASDTPVKAGRAPRGARGLARRGARAERIPAAERTPSQEVRRLSYCGSILRSSRAAGPAAVAALAATRAPRSAPEAEREDPMPNKAAAR